MNSLNSSFSDRMTERATTSKLLNNFLTHTVTFTISCLTCTHHTHIHAHMNVNTYTYYFDLKAKKMYEG